MASVRMREIFLPDVERDAVGVQVVRGGAKRVSLVRVEVLLELTERAR